MNEKVRAATAIVLSIIECDTINRKSWKELIQFYWEEKMLCAVNVVHVITITLLTISKTKALEKASERASILQRSLTASWSINLTTSPVPSLHSLPTLITVRVYVSIRSLSVNIWLCVLIHMNSYHIKISYHIL